MAEPIREQILAALATRMGATRAPMPGDFDDRTVWPQVGLIDGEESVLQRRYGKVTLNMSVRIEKIDEFETTDGIPIIGKSLLANRLMAQLIQTAFSADQTLGGLAQGMEYGGGSTVYSDEQSRLAAAYILVTVRYVTTDGDPYTV